MSESWFYKHKNQTEPTAVRRRRDELDAAVVELFGASDGTYGSPRIHDELTERPGFERLSVNTVAGSMNRQGLAARPKKRGRSLTRPDKGAVPFPNRLNRQFSTDAPDVVWVGEITEIVTWDGKLYLSTVIDLYSRRLIGFALDTNCKAPLVCDALKMAIATRAGDVAGVIFHSDRGSQYSAGSFTSLCDRNKVVQSMSRAGSCLDCDDGGCREVRRSRRLSTDTASRGQTLVMTDHGVHALTCRPLDAVSCCLAGRTGSDLIGA